MSRFVPAEGGEPLGGARRVLVYGVTGSGKTTLAERISRLTGLPWYSVDDLTWQPGWVPVPADEQRRRIEAICAGPEWILDTAYSQWLEVALARAELVVALDYSRLFSLQRLVRRTAVRMVRGTRVCNGNRESLRILFSKESIVWWHFVSFGHKRARIRGWMADGDGPRVLCFGDSGQTEAWLARLSRA